MNTDDEVMRRGWLWLAVCIAIGLGWGLFGRGLGCSPAW